MFLIESRINGVLVRQHWDSLSGTREEAHRKIDWMEKTFGPEYSHTVRELTQSEREAAVLKAAASKQEEWAKVPDEELDAWMRECLRIGKKNETS